MAGAEAPRAEVEAQARKASSTTVGLKRLRAQAAVRSSPGGMKQRVGIARALSIEPKIMLMDEPFSALDALTRGTLQDEVRRICRETGQTVFMITHDVDEAIYLADRIVLMTNGPAGDDRRDRRVNPLAADRRRETIHHDPAYTDLRNHLIDFLVSRSKTFRDAPPDGYDQRNPPLVVLARERAVHRRPPCAPRNKLINHRRAAMKRADLTEKILDIKREKNWTWKHITDHIGGMSPVLVDRRAARPDEADQAARGEGRRAVRIDHRRRTHAQRSRRCAACRCRRPIP